MQAGPTVGSEHNSLMLQEPVMVGVSLLNILCHFELESKLAPVREKLTFDLLSCGILFCLECFRISMLRLGVGDKTNMTAAPIREIYYIGDV